MHIDGTERRLLCTLDIPRMQPVTSPEKMEPWQAIPGGHNEWDVASMHSVFDLGLPMEPALPRNLRRLSTAQSYAVFVLNAVLERQRKLDGPSYHAHLAALLCHNIDTENEMRACLKEILCDVPVHGNSLLMARRQADRWLEEGLWVASWRGEACPSSDTTRQCPQVLFGKGDIQTFRLWSAFFNSRKSKVISPQAEWLQILRTLLPLVISQDLGILCSLGTLTYDLVAAGAERLGASLLLLIPTPLAGFGTSKDSPLLDPASFPGPVLTCLTGVVGCPKRTRMVCRDRIIALASDLRWVVELRPEGNLFKILEEQQRIQPRPLWIYHPETKCRENAGNVQLLQEFSESATGFSRADLQVSAAPRPSLELGKGSDHPVRLLKISDINLQDYLYHYVRPCPGPWPGQSYRGFLEGLFYDEPLAGHTALETLMRILLEKRIRAGSKIVRGDQSVISWTSRPPLEISSMRRWNPALMRWTLEPYGIAVKRQLLKKRGAKPAVYGATAVYEKLPAAERFRFQLHEPPRCSWKNEREWRMPDDLELTGSVVDDAFGFVPTAADVETLEQYPRCALPIAVFPDSCR
jgi:hypothetical protein